MYQLKIDSKTDVTGSDHQKHICITQYESYRNEYVNVILTFEELAEIVNWANRNMKALILTANK